MTNVFQRIKIETVCTVSCTSLNFFTRQFNYYFMLHSLHFITLLLTYSISDSDFNHSKDISNLSPKNDIPRKEHKSLLLSEKILEWTHTSYSPALVLFSVVCIIQFLTRHLNYYFILFSLHFLIIRLINVTPDSVLYFSRYVFFLNHPRSHSSRHLSFPFIATFSFPFLPFLH